MDDERNRWAAAVVLGDGESAFVRPIEPADATALRAFHERQPSEAQYRRFFSPKPTLSDVELRHFTEVDFHDRVALVLELRGEFVAWASYERWKGRSDADVAFMVDADQRGKGIATLLLEHLAAIARAKGITRFTAETLADNRSMLAVFSRAGWPVKRHFDSGIVDVEFSVDDTEQFVDSVESREHRADSRAVARLLLPRSIAVIGASDRPSSIGHELWRNVQRSGVPVFAVNPRHTHLDGVPCHPSVDAIADDVWLAVIAVPVAALPATIEQCIAKRVRGAVVVTAVDTGVGSTDGSAGFDLAGLVEHARRNGLRLIGPASMGIASSAEPGGTGLSAALVPVDLPRGRIAISMQSGSLGSSLLHLAGQMSMGISWFVSLGDKCDISGNDLLQFWEDDDATSVIALYTESFGNPRKFARIARRVARRRPIVAVRTGAAAIGTAGSALYQQAGLIEVPTVSDLLHTTRVLADQPIPRGPRVAVLTNARSPGVLAAAAIGAAGLTEVEPPVRLDWRATPADYEAALRAALGSPSVDAVLVLHAPPVATAPAPIDQIDRAAAGATKPVVAVLLGRDDGPIAPGSRVPTFSFPEPAAAVLGRMWAYAHWLATEADAPAGELGGLDVDGAAHLLEQVLDRGAQRCSRDECATLLRRYGISVPATVTTVGATAEQIAAVAHEVGMPVAVKAAHRRVGRSAAAGVALDLADADAVRDAVARMRAALGDGADELVVQAMVAPGVDVRVHCTTDTPLGPVVTVGLGGMQADLIGDGASRLAPVSPAGAVQLIEQSRVGAALAAAQVPADALVDAICRIARLSADHPHIDSIDVNPLIVAADGCAATDIAVELTTTDRDAPPLRRI